MILVAGESLLDLIVNPDGSINPSPGGGPFNAARTMSRLGQPTRFLGCFSADPFGARLVGRLREDRAEAGSPDPVPAPTALAVVAVSGAGVPRYWFHLTGTAGFQLDLPAARQALDAQVAALHIGTLGLVVEPMASEIEQLVTELPESVLLLLDPNCRPAATADPDGYRARIKRILPRADIVKTSVEDLRFLMPRASAPEAARALIMAGAGCVLVTHGPDPVEAFTGDHHLAEPVPPVTVTDTVGAGDAFGGGFLAWWVEHKLDRDGLADPDLMRAAIAAGNRVAALTCTKAGAEPPWRHELDAWRPA
ncbi:MAG TPA: PfkB family carbohydrate kinase [Streptosporangiaceae bacterium]|nr:PfkB family carbohydrate kinase [Streptosporangiaceae bacterium]